MADHRHGTCFKEQNVEPFLKTSSEPVYLQKQGHPPRGRWLLVEDGPRDKRQGIEGLGRGRSDRDNQRAGFIMLVSFFDPTEGAPTEIS